MTNADSPCGLAARPASLVTRAALVAALVIPSAMLPTVASAVTPEERAAADQLFNDGRAAVKKGDYAVGCPKLASSQQLDPAIGTLLALGDCYELGGQTASAWATFGDAAAMAQKANDKPREEEANRRAGLLAPKLSKLVIEIPKDQVTPDAKITRNGKPVALATLGSAIPVDPGKQSVEVDIPGRNRWSGEITVAPGPGVATLNVPPLAKIEEKDPTPNPKDPAGPVRPGPGPKPDAPTSSWNGQKTAGIVVGVIGIVGLGVGAGFGGATLAKVGDISDQGLCDESDPPRCSPAGIEAHQDADTLANVSNVGLAVGGAALLTGIIVFATAPRGSSAKPAADAKAAAAPTFQLRAGASPVGARVTLRGTF